MVDKIQDAQAEKDELSALYELRPELETPGYWQALSDNCDQWASEFTVCPLWRAASENLTRWRQEYRETFGAELLSVGRLPDFVAKSQSSIKNKLARKLRAEEDLEVILSKTGPPIPQVGDLVRTRVVCKYIDGVEYLTTKLCDLASTMKIDTKRERQGRLEGYFAQHINFESDVFYRVGGFPTATRVKCEIQLATDFGTRMWDATHKLYEVERDKDRDPAAWQWAPSDPRFMANQLGHMMHLADGLLVQLRGQLIDNKAPK